MLSTISSFLPTSCPFPTPTICCYLLLVSLILLLLAADQIAPGSSGFCLALSKIGCEGPPPEQADATHFLWKNATNWPTSIFLRGFGDQKGAQTGHLGNKIITGFLIFLPPFEPINNFQPFFAGFSRHLSWPSLLNPPLSEWTRRPTINYEPTKANKQALSDQPECSRPEVHSRHPGRTREVPLF